MASDDATQAPGKEAEWELEKSALLFSLLFFPFQLSTRQVPRALFHPPELIFPPSLRMETSTAKPGSSGSSLSTMVLLPEHLVLGLG